jgi:hypothetical protein
MIEAHARQIGADFVAVATQTHNCCRFEKFRTHPFAQAYEWTLYVDADAFLTDETPDLFYFAPLSEPASNKP